MLRKLQAGLPLLVLTAGLLAAGYWMLFSHFAFFDDEGYILLSVRSYLEHGGLYGSVYSQYGPSFYVLFDALHGFTGWMVDNSSARLFTLALWFGCAGCSAVLVSRTTRWPVLGLGVLPVVFLYLHGQSEEPFHPGSLIILVLAASALWSLALLQRGALGGVAGVLGAAGAFLTLIKINVGFLFLGGCVLWGFLTTPFLAARPRWRGGALAAIALGAGLLMHAHVREHWVHVFLAVFGVGLLGLTASIRSAHVFSGRHLGIFAGAALLTGLGIAAVVVLRGTTPAALLEGILLGPLRHADNYYYPVDWRPGTLVAALASGLALGGQAWLRLHGREPAADRWVVGLRLAQLGGLLAAVALLIDFRVVGTVFSYAVPWLWIWIVPVETASVPRTVEARGFLGCLLLLQFLHAYPVGGSQESWGTFLLFPLVALAIPETIARMETGPRPRRWLRPTLLALGALVVGGKTVRVAWVNQQAYAAMADFGLPGTGGMRLSRRETLVYQTLVYNGVFHSDRLFTLPGMCSFNLWSEIPPPTGKNTTLWFTLLNPVEQREIIQALQHAAKPVVIAHQGLLALLASNGFPPSGPLHAYLTGNYHAAFMLDGFGFWVKNGRNVVPIGLAVDYRRAPAAISFGAWVANDGRGLTEIRLVTTAPSGERTLTLDHKNTQVRVQPLHPDGTPSGAATLEPWPVRFRGLARITVTASGVDDGGVPPSFLSLRDSGGQEIGSALFGGVP